MVDSGCCEALLEVTSFCVRRVVLCRCLLLSCFHRFLAALAYCSFCLFLSSNIVLYIQVFYQSFLWYNEKNNVSYHTEWKQRLITMW